MGEKSSAQPTVEDTVARISELWSILIGQAVLFNEQVARSLGISAVDLQTFGIISRHGGPITPSEVATEARLPASTTTRVLDRLEQAGFITRGAVAADRRKVAVQIVEERAREIAGRYEEKVDAIRALNSRRSAAELTAIISYLTDLAARDES